MSNLTGKFLVVGGVRFAQVADGGDNNPCMSCAFQVPGPYTCRVDGRVEREQGLDCVYDGAHYEVVE